MILDPIDQNIRDQGFNFVPFDRYLDGPFQPNTLAMSGSGLSSFGTPESIPTGRFGLPVLFPGRDGTDGSTTTGPVDQGLTTADFAPDQSMTGTMGMTEEEQEAINNMNNPGFTGKQLGMIGLQSFFNPFGAIINAFRTKKKNEAAALEQAQAAATAARAAENRAAGRGGYQSNFAQDKDFMEGPSGAGTGLGASDKGGSDSMGSFMDGGIVDLVDIYD